MYKLCLNSRDELLIIDLEKIAYFQANGNYTHLNYIAGETHLLTVGLSKVEEFIRGTWPKDRPSPFVRLGRSLIVNQTYIGNQCDTSETHPFRPRRARALAYGAQTIAETIQGKNKRTIP